jgi:hypothetical protein
MLTCPNPPPVTLVMDLYDDYWRTLAAGITHLTVLRAHLLSVARLQALLDLRDRTGVRLVLVCHQHRVPTALERALRPGAHHRADAAAVLPGPQEQAPRRPPHRGRWPAGG